MRKKRIVVFIIFFIFFFLFVGGRIFYLNQIVRSLYDQNLKTKTEIYIEGESAPRGRIMDVNGVILVDNEAIQNIVYHKVGNLSIEEEVEIAKDILMVIDCEFANIEDLKTFYLLMYPDASRELITEKERDLVKERKLSSDDLKLYQRERITDEMLKVFTPLEKKVAQLYLKMNEGYVYQNKVILKDASASVVAHFSEKKISGLFIETSWKRSYPYQDTLRSVFGTLSYGIPKERKEEFLNQGYQLSDVVGISYLEEQYENVLKGTKAKYYVNADKSLTLVDPSKRGNDVVLSIDIKLQEKIIEILKDTFYQVKKMPNTELLKESYVVIGNPDTGSIRAMVGLRILENGKDITFQDVSTNSFLSSFTSGSIVKGASHTVGYLNNVIPLNKKVKDSCVKLYLVPEKCSYKDLGYVDDITALKTSSNYFQFLTAINITGQKYFYNMKLNATPEDFLKYRSVFSDFGLGSKTGIDLPNEQNGIIGKKISDDLLLNLSIGQYDTYTPIQLLQYIHTIHTNGVRNNLSLMKEIVNESGEVISKKKETILSTISLDSSYFERIREGFRQVLAFGTGSGYVNKTYQTYGKTGTAESFYDSNLDGVVDTKTISSTFAMVEQIKTNPYSLAIVTPNLSHYDGMKDYTAPMNRILSNKITDYLHQNS